MSEQTFAPGAVTGDEPSGTADTPAAGRPYKTWIVAGAVGLVVALAAYFLFFSGGSDTPAADDSGLVAKPVTSTQPSASASASASAVASNLPVTQVGTAGRDPFKATVTAPSPKPTVASSAPAPSTAPSTAPSASGITTPTTGVPNQLSVSSVDAKNGIVATKVNGKGYVISLGKVFATYFKLIAVGPTPSCAIFQYGDTTVPLCTGQSLTLTG